MNESRSYHRHLGNAVGVHNPRSLMQEVDGFNAKAAVAISDLLGSMAFFWLTVALALTSLPAVLTLVSPGLKGFFPAWLIKVALISLVSWFAQTLIQLVALPVLQVSSNAQGRQQEHDTKVLLADAETTREQTASILDALDVHTQGGLKEVLDAIERLKKPPRKGTPK